MPSLSRRRRLVSQVNRAKKGARSKPARSSKKRRPSETFHPPVRRTVRFNFVADVSYHEQLSVMEGDVVSVLKDCGDGWSEVVGVGGESGVVPTGFLGTYTPDSAARSMLNKAATWLMDRAVVLVSMGGAWLAATSVSLASTGGAAAMAACKDAYRIYIVEGSSKSGSMYTRTTHSVYTYALWLLVPALSDEELAKVRVRCLRHVERVEAELAKR